MTLPLSPGILLFYYHVELKQHIPPPKVKSRLLLHFLPLYLYSHTTSRQCWFSLHLKSNLPHSLKKISVNSNLNEIMFAPSKIALFVSFALMVPTSLVGAVPHPHGRDHENSSVSGPATKQFSVPVNSTGPLTPAESSSTYWLSSIKRQGTVPFGEASFKVFRNVREYGAAGMSFFRTSFSFPVALS